MTKKLGIWAAVIFIHFLLWIAFGHRSEVLRPGRDSGPSLIVVPVISDIESNHATESIKADPMDISETTPNSRKHTPVKPRSIGKMEASAGTKKSNRMLGDSDEVMNSAASSSQPPDNASSRKIKSLDFDGMERVVRRIAHESTDRVLPGVNRKLTNAEKFSEEIDHAKRGDCRSAYAGIGILAIPFLLKDTVTGGGCKW